MLKLNSFGRAKYEQSIYKTSRSPAQAKITSPVTIYVYCDDLEQKYKNAKQANLTILDVRFWGDKTFRVEDPDGYIWDFATWVADFDPSKLPPELK